jgi:hypothetical protein
MFAWIKRRKYRREVLAHLQAILFDASAATLKPSYPGIDKAIDDGFTEKRSKEALSVNLAGAVLSNAIEQISDAGRRHRMAQEIRSWASEPDGVAKFRQAWTPSNGSCNGPWFMSRAFMTSTSSTGKQKVGLTAKSSARLPGSRRSIRKPGRDLARGRTYCGPYAINWPSP